MSDLLPEGFVLDDAPAAPTGSALPDGFVLDDPAPATGTSELATDPGHIRANQVAAERAAKEPNLRNVPGPNGYSADNPPYKDGAYENRKQPPRPAQPEATWLTDLQSGWNNLMSGFAGTSLESGAKNEADTDRAIDAMKRAGTATPEQIAYLELRKKQIQQDQADAAQTLAIGAAKQAQLPPTPESVQRFNNATGWMDALSAFAADPYTISRSTILQSAPASIPSALGGIMGSILGPMGSSMGAGGGSYITELGGAVQEGLQRFGADMNDPASIMQVWSQHKAEISKYAQTRATVVGGADALTAGISSKFAGVNPVDQIIKGNIKRELLGIGIEAPGGMVGEAGAQLATEGRINQPGQVLAEGLGEVVPGAVQVAGSTVVQRALKGDRETAPQQPPPQPQQPAPGKGDRIEPQMFPEAQKAPVRPMQSNGYDVSPQTGDPSDDEVLHGAGYTPEQIAEMHPAEKAQEAADARAQGVQPKPLPPAPGTAPLAPGFRPTAPVQQQEAPAAELQQSQQASSPQTEPPAGFVVDQPQPAPINPQQHLAALEQKLEAERKTAKTIHGTRTKLPGIAGVIDEALITPVHSHINSNTKHQMAAAEQYGRADLADYIASRAEQAATTMGTEPGFPPGHPKYDAIKANLAKRKADAIAGAQELRNRANAIAAKPQAPAPGTAPMAPRVQTALYPPSQADKAFSTFFASKAPITPEALAKASGMPQKDAVKAIQRAALRGSIIQTRQGRWMRAPTRVKPISAMQFIASIGGISDPTGELAGMDLPKMGPYGPVVRKTGLHPDKVREALVEAGYMRDPGVEAGGQATTTVNDVYALLDNEMRGQKAYQPQDQARADALDTQAKNDALPPDYQPVHHIAQRFGVETWNKVKTALDTHGLDEGNWSTQELSDAARMVTEGQDPEDALVAAAIRFEDDANDPEAQFPEVQEWLQKRDPRAMLLFDHPPFPDVEPANAGQEIADGESPGSAQPVSGGEGPGTQEAAAGPGEEASVPRQDGSEGQDGVIDRAARKTRNAEHSRIRGVVRDKTEVLQSEARHVQTLRGEGHSDVPAVGGELHPVFQGNRIPPSPEGDNRQDKQQQGLRTGQYPVGDYARPSQQQANERASEPQGSANDSGGSRAPNGARRESGKQSAETGAADLKSNDSSPFTERTTYNDDRLRHDQTPDSMGERKGVAPASGSQQAEKGVDAGGGAATKDAAELDQTRQGRQRQVPVAAKQELFSSIRTRRNTNSENFRKWFGASKVVDTAGNPIIVYHGTPAGDFSSFDTYASNYGLMGQGGYFTEDPSVASEYTSKGAAKMERRGETPAHTVYPVYLSIKNPIDMNAAPNIEAWVKAYGDYVTADDFAEAKTNEDAYRVVEDALKDEYLPMHEGAEIMQDGLRAMGHDGITHIGGQYVRKDGKEHRVWIAFDPDQIKSIHNNGEFDRNNPAILSSRNASDDGSSFAATVMRELAKVDDLFQNPRSDAKTLDGVIGDIVFGFEKIPNVPISEAERALGAVTKSGWRNEDGFDFFVLEDGDGQVWMDISNFAPGLRGSAPYAAVANYAHNVGKVFIGDPSGLSNDALRRRTEAMLSSAIKFGTTRHLEPHKRQLEGDPDLGIPPMEWTYGDDAANVASLINASIANTTNLTPEIANARFDFDTGTFRDAQGQRLSDEILDGWRRSDRRIREARASYSTIRRGVFLKSLAQAERGERPRLLEQALRELRQLVESGDLKATLYNRPGQSRVPPNRYRYNISPQQEAEITADIQATAKRILGRHLVGVEVRRDLSKEFSAEEDAVYDPNTGLIWVALQGKQNPRTSIRHEAIHALRNAGVFTKQEWAALTRMAHGKWIEQYDIRARYERLYRERFDLTEAQIQELIVEEAIAEGYAEHVATERDDQSVAGRIFTRLRRFLEALRNMLAGRGFTSVDQIIRGVDEGQFGRRNAGAGQGRDFLLYAKQPQQDRLSSRGSNVQERLSAVPPDDGAPGRHPTGDPIREFAASAEAARRLEDLAGNINLRYIKAPEDVKQTLRDVAEQAGGFINARRGKISHEQTARLAAELGMSERELLKRKQGQAFNAEQLFAARALLLQSSKRLTSLASRAKNSGSTADLAEFHKAFTRHAAIQEQIAGMTAEAGRALNQFKMLAGQDYFKQARNIMENAKSQKEFGPDAVRDLAEMIDGMKDGAQIGRITRTAFKTTTMDILRELWINALLSGPRTHATNILSNGLTALLQVPETAVAATISGLRGDRDGVRAGEAMARLIGLMEGAREGMQNARIAFRTGEPTDISSKLEYHNNNAIPGKLGTIIRTPSRALMAADELFKAINYRAEINAQAVRLAMREGVKGNLLARRIADYRNEPTMAMQDAAHEHALYQTFQNAMGPIAQPLMRLRERIPGAWLVLPFIRTPANIFKYAAERTPFGLAMREVRERMASGDAVVRDTQMARLALGGMIAVGIASLAMAGLISGGGPNDDDEKKIKRATGWQPYSFKIGDTWYSYQRLDPLGFQIGLIADLWETGGNLESAEADKIGAVIIKAIADGVLNKTYLSGLSDFTEAMNDPDRYADGYLRNFAGTLIPTGVAQVAQSFDPVYRDARTSLDKIKSLIPGLSQALPARRDVFGEAMTNEGSLGPDLISPIYATSEKDNPIAQAMIDADYFPGMPRRTIGKHELTPEQYDRYAEISGKRAVQLLQNRVTAPNWKGLGRDRQEKIIKKGFDDAREFARKKMMREFPELRKSAEPSTVE